jgi:hypothetical protein
VRKLALVLAVTTVLTAGPLLAQSDPVLFVSSLEGGEIFRVNGATGQTQKIHSSSGSRFEDLVIGPDTLLYACDPTNGRIVRMTQTGASVQLVYEATAVGPQSFQCGRFTHAGDLLFNTPSGVWMISAAQLAALPALANPVQLTAAGGDGRQGLAVTVNGDVLMADGAGGRVFRSMHPDFGAIAEIIGGLTQPAGLARNSLNRAFVSTENGIVKCDLEGSCASFATFTGRRAWHVEFAADDTLYAATAVALERASWPQGNISNANGHIWRITGPGPCPGTNCQLVTALNAKVNGRFLPAVGLAIGPTCAERIEAGVTNALKRFNFNSHFFEIQRENTFAVDVRVRACQRPPADVTADFAANLPPGVAAHGLPYSGENGWIIEYQADAFSPGTSTKVSPGPTSISVGFFLPDAFGVNPRVTRNYSQILDGASYYPTGPLDAPPGDPISAGRANDFSDFVMADIQLVQEGNFCGFQPPLSESNTAEFNQGKKIPFKFKLAAPGGNCQNGPYITQAEARLSIARIDQFQIIAFTVVGATGSDSATFRFETQGQQFGITVDSTGLAPGLYLGTVISDSFLPRSVFFIIKE